MSTVVNKAIVLSLNRAWQAIGISTVGEAFTAMMGGKRDARGNSMPPAMAMDIEYALNEDGTPNTDKLLKAIPTSFAEWKNLPIRSYDEVILTSSGPIRVPTILCQRNYEDMPEVSPKFSAAAVRRRDKSICQYTNEVVGPGEGNLDHVIPRDKGGKDTFENVVWSKRTVNSMKGNRLNHEVGLTLRRKPVAPPRLKKCVTIEAKHPSHHHFLVVK